MKYGVFPAKFPLNQSNELRSICSAIDITAVDRSQAAPRSPQMKRLQSVPRSQWTTWNDRWLKTRHTRFVQDNEWHLPYIPPKKQQ